MYPRNSGWTRFWKRFCTKINCNTLWHSTSKVGFQGAKVKQTHLKVGAAVPQGSGNYVFVCTQTSQSYFLPHYTYEQTCHWNKFVFPKKSRQNRLSTNPRWFLVRCTDWRFVCPAIVFISSRKIVCDICAAMFTHTIASKTLADTNREQKSINKLS